MAASESHPSERFWPKVQQPIDIDDCWEWTAAANPSGHGRFWLDGSNIPSHRYAYELLRGPIPEGKHMDHLCENPSCVNPWHLEPVDLWENLRRCDDTPAVINARKTHCKRGHPFDDENTHVTKAGSRVCRTCARIRARRYRAEKREREAA